MSASKDRNCKKKIKLYLVRLPTGRRKPVGYIYKRDARGIRLMITVNKIQLGVTARFELGLLNCKFYT